MTKFLAGKRILHGGLPVMYVLLLATLLLAQARSVSQGVYSKAQAIRGQSLYRAECARCHGETLLGGEDAPAIVDGEFLDKWNGNSVGALVELIRKTMPSDGPGHLTRKQCVDMAAYILSANKFPAGEKELDNDLAVLNEIKIEAKR